MNELNTNQNEFIKLNSFAIGTSAWVFDGVCGIGNVESPDELKSTRHKKKKEEIVKKKSHAGVQMKLFRLE